MARIGHFQRDGPRVQGFGLASDIPCTGFGLICLWWVCGRQADSSSFSGLKHRMPVEWNSNLKLAGLGPVGSSVWACGLHTYIWEFPKIGDSNIVP